MVIKHRSSTARATDDAWTIQDGALVVQLRGRAPADIAIDVCSERYPRSGHFVLQRLDEERWRVAPVLYLHRGGQWVTRPARYDERLPHEDLVLTGAREEDSRWLAQR
jgi:hypothetical protein